MTAAPYACSGVTTYSAIKKLESVLDQPIVIFGAGGLGLMALSILKAMGGKGAIVVDIDESKRKPAEEAGALGFVNGAAPDALQQIAAKAGRPVLGAIDLVGNAATAQLGFDCLSKGGKLVMVGLFGGGAPWALPLIPIKAITIQGSYVGNLRETQELIDLVREKRIAPIPVTKVPLKQDRFRAQRSEEGQACRPCGARSLTQFIWSVLQAAERQARCPSFADQARSEIRAAGTYRASWYSGSGPGRRMARTPSAFPYSMIIFMNQQAEPHALEVGPDQHGEFGARKVASV